jgi:hypothetical protein
MASYQSFNASGWTNVPLSPLNSALIKNTWFSVLYRIATGTDPTASTGGSALVLIGQIMGITAGTFLASDPFGASASGASTVTRVAPGVTTVRPNSLIVSCVGAPTVTAGSVITGWANGLLDSVTTQIDIGSAISAGSGIGAMTGVKRVTEPSGPSTYVEGSGFDNNVLTLAVNGTDGFVSDTPRYDFGRGSA